MPSKASVKKFLGRGLEYYTGGLLSGDQLDEMVGQEEKAPTADEYYRKAMELQGEDRQRFLDAADRARKFAPTQQIRDPRQISTRGVTAPDIEAVREGQASDAGAVERVGARDVANPYLGATREVQSEGIRGVEAAAADVKRAGVPSEARSMMLARAKGEGPSRAELMALSAGDKASKAMMGQAQALRGVQRAAGRRDAMMKAGDITAEGVQKAAEIRAGEMSEAQGQFANFEQQSAQLEQQANSLQAQLQTAVAQGNRDAANEIQAQIAQLKQQASELNAAAANRRDETRAGMEADIATANADRNLRASEFGANAANRRADDFAGRRDVVQNQNLERESRRRAELARLGLSAQEIDAQLRLDADKANQSADMRVDENRVRQELDVEGIRQRGEYAGIEGASGTTRGIVGVERQKYEDEADAYYARKEADAQRRRGIQQSFSTAASMGMSGGTQPLSTGQIDQLDRSAAGRKAREDEERRRGYNPYDSSGAYKY